MKQTGILMRQVSGQLDAINDLISLIMDTHGSYLTELITTNRKTQAFGMIKKALKNKNFLGETFQDLIADSMVRDIEKEQELKMRKIETRTTPSNNLNMVGYNKTITTSCGDCGGDAKLEGFFSNGTPIHDPYTDSTYRPLEDELLKIGHIKCSDCGSEQWS